MTYLNILQYPDERLHIVAKPLADDEFNETLQQIVRDMTETMYAAQGIGLAAIQVDIHKRIIVMDISHTRDQLQVFINPVIMAKEGSLSFEEGCLSVPGIYETVKRAEKITLKAQDQYGKSFSLEATGLLAVCIQHEIDHLDGKVFIEKLSQLKLGRIITRIKKQQRQNF